LKATLILLSAVFQILSGSVWINLTLANMRQRAAGFGGDEFNREHALMGGVRLHRAVNETPVITEVWSVDTPVGAAGHVDVLLAVRPLADYEVRILPRLHFSKSLAVSSRATEWIQIVDLVWIQLQPDKLFDTTNKGKGFEL
jgi:hypothetical protein